MATTPLSQAEQAQVAKLRQSMLTSDMAKQQKLIDELDPASAYKKRLYDANVNAGTFINSTTTQYVAEKTEVENTMNLIELAEKAKYPLERHKLNLSEKKKKYDKENKELEQAIRANRRRFLDNEPQVGVFSLFGQKTSDDKVMLGFWIGLLILTTTVVFAVITYTQKQHVPAYYLGANFATILTAYLIIYYTS